MALKDWMEAIMLRCRLSGSTMHSDTAKSRSTRKVPVTWGHSAGLGRRHPEAPVLPAQGPGLAPGHSAGLSWPACSRRSETGAVRGVTQASRHREGPYLKPKQPSKEGGPQVANDNVEGNAGPQHQPDHAAKKEVVLSMAFPRSRAQHGRSRALS